MTSLKMKRLKPITTNHNYIRHVEFTNKVSSYRIQKTAGMFIIQ